jgi:hypothetical protein
LKAKLYEQVGQEIKYLRDKGKIPDDFADERKNKYGFKSWVDLMKAIDDDPPDADLLEALMAMFYGANKINTTDAKRMLSYQLLQIARRLNSSELLLLKAVLDAPKHHSFHPNDPMPLRRWAEIIAHVQGHYVVSLVLRDERALVEQQLISGYLDGTVTPSNQTVSSTDARLTDLGKKFCENIEMYRSDTAE